ncbi:MAG TPA: hypothetical protein VEB63_10005, partial [Chitinophagaceae bacterium]|nr:hypothetical protein [Chitinophagaceae bacterium]
SNLPLVPFRFPIAARRSDIFVVLDKATGFSGKIRRAALNSGQSVEKNETFFGETQKRRGKSGRSINIIFILNIS